MAQVYWLLTKSFRGIIVFLLLLSMTRAFQSLWHHMIDFSCRISFCLWRNL